jgi:hypothetical protein
MNTMLYSKGQRNTHNYATLSAKKANKYKQIPCVSRKFQKGSRNEYIFWEIKKLEIKLLV